MAQCLKHEMESPCRTEDGQLVEGQPTLPVLIEMRTIFLMQEMQEKQVCSGHMLLLKRNIQCVFLTCMLDIHFKVLLDIYLLKYLG